MGLNLTMNCLVPGLHSSEIGTKSFVLRFRSSFDLGLVHLLKRISSKYLREYSTRSDAAVPIAVAKGELAPEMARLSLNVSSAIKRNGLSFRKIDVGFLTIYPSWLGRCSIREALFSDTFIANLVCSPQAQMKYKRNLVRTIVSVFQSTGASGRTI